MSQLNQIRPRLWHVAPLTTSIVLIFGLANLVMASGMWGLDNPSLVVTNLTPWRLWAAVYAGMGVVMLYGLIRNDWDLMRVAMLAGVLVKAIWWFAVTLSLHNAGGLVIFGLWTAFMAIQFFTYLYFIPNRPVSDGRP